MERYVVKANGIEIGHAETLKKAKGIINDREYVKAKWFETAEELEASLKNTPKYTIEKEIIT